MVETNEFQTELGKQMLALTLKIETRMRAKTQVSVITPSFPICDRCEIVHGIGENIVDDGLTTTMDKINFVWGRNNFYNQYPNNFNQGQGFR